MLNTNYWNVKALARKTTSEKIDTANRQMKWTQDELEAAKQKRNKVIIKKEKKKTANEDHNTANTG